MPRQPNRQIGHINLVVKPIGKPGAGKPHAGFDAAGTGDRVRQDIEALSTERDRKQNRPA